MLKRSGVRPVFCMLVLAGSLVGAPAHPQPAGSDALPQIEPLGVHVPGTSQQFPVIQLFPPGSGVMRIQGLDAQQDRSVVIPNSGIVIPGSGFGAPSFMGRTVIVPEREAQSAGAQIAVGRAELFQLCRIYEMRRSLQEDRDVCEFAGCKALMPQTCGATARQ